MPNNEPVIPKHGGYRRLVSFRIAQLTYDVTVRFCNRYVDRKSRTHDQMIQAARSGVQNIAEGSQASGTSKKTELRLTDVARASLEELKLDYEDFLRHRNLTLWPDGDPRRKSLVAQRCATADAVAKWAVALHHNEVPQLSSSRLPNASYPEIAANAAHTLVGVACALLDRQITTLAESFKEEGGFSERLYRVRAQHRSE